MCLCNEYLWSLSMIRNNGHIKSYGIQYWLEKKLIIPDDTPQLNILFAWFRLKILTYILHLLLKREICKGEDEEKHRLVIFFLQFYPITKIDCSLAWKQ